MHIGKANSGYSIALHLQSETLWFLPPFGPLLANPREGPLPPYLALANDVTAVAPYDEHEQVGAFELPDPVVLVPKAHILTEALMRIAARDYHQHDTVGAWSIAHYAYIKLYVQPLGRLDPSLLPEPFDRLYRDERKMTPLEFHTRLLRACGVPLWKPEMYR
jgi:hypothetical protein